MIVTLDTRRRITVLSTLAPTKPGDYFDARFESLTRARSLRH